MQDTQKIIVLATGGTIAGISPDTTDSLNYQSAQLSINQLIAQTAPARTTKLAIITEQLAQIDSKDMDFSIWQKLLARCCFWQTQPDVEAIIITHGTDTVEESSYFLQQALADLSIPIIFTCAMRPNNVPDSDGQQNLIDAITVAAAKLTPAVMLVSYGEIHHANYLQKTHATNLDTFRSYPQQLIGTISQGKLQLNPHFSYPTNQFLTNFSSKILATNPANWPKVEIMFCYVNQSTSMLEHWLKQPIDGLVVAATGNATLNENLLTKLQLLNQHCLIWLSTRCIFGGVTKTTTCFQLTTEPLVKARIKLMLTLLANKL